MKFLQIKKTSRAYPDFLLARILSADRSAIVGCKKIFQASTKEKKWVYAGLAEEFLDRVTYEEIVGKDYKDDYPE